MYDVYSYDAFTNPNSKANQLVNEPLYRKMRVSVVQEFLKRNSLPARPILPSVTPFFAPGGNAVENSLIPDGELVSDQIKPLIDAGCDGMAIWTAGSYWVKLATQPTNTSQTQKRLRTVYRTAYLGGAEPSSWVTPELKATLNTKVAGGVTKMAELGVAEAKAAKQPPKKDEQKVAGQGGQ